MLTPSSRWETIATYCTRLAPVLGPLLNAAAEAAMALHQAELESRRSAISIDVPPNE